MIEESLKNQEGGLSEKDERDLREIGKRLDEGGYFPQEALEVIIRNRHFHLFVPQKYGGLDYPLGRAMRVIEAYSIIEGNLGWIVQIGAGGGIFGAYLEEDVARTFLGRPDQVIAGSDFVGGIARPVDGGYRLSGEWAYASGSLHATAFTGNCRIDGGLDADRIKAFIVPSGEVHVIRNWDALGMRATDSHSFRMDEVFVPESQLFTIAPDYLVQPTRTSGLPFQLFARALFMPVLTGIVFDYVNRCKDYLDQRNKAGDIHFLRSWEQLDEALKSARNELYDQAEKVSAFTASDWPEKDFRTELNDRFRDICLRITGKLLEAADHCHRHTGMKGIHMKDPINVAYRNLKTVAAHRLLRASSMS